MKKNLTPKQESFIEHYLSGVNGVDAAIAAGYSPTSAKFQASNLLRNNEMVKTAIQSAQAEFKERRQFSIETAVVEAEELALEAKSAKQFAVAAKLLELKCKLYGLLIQKVEVKETKIDIRAILEEADKRIDYSVLDPHKISI